MLGVLEGKVSNYRRLRDRSNQKVPWMDEVTVASRRFDWKNQLRRIKFSFRKEEWEQLVDKLDRSNAVLKELLGGSDKLALGRSRRNIELPNSWKLIRERATSLFEAVGSPWGCDCASSHCVSLLLDDLVEYGGNERRGEDLNLKLWFAFGMRPDNREQGAPWDWHHAEVCSIPHYREEEIEKYASLELHSKTLISEISVVNSNNSTSDSVISNSRRLWK